MIILRQKGFATGVERMMAKESLKKVGKRRVKNINLISPKTKRRISKALKGIGEEINDSKDIIRSYYGLEDYI